MKSEYKLISVVALAIGFAVAGWACPHLGDAMDDSYGRCSGLSTGACTYSEATLPIYCQPMNDYYCDVSDVTRSVFTRTWSGTCSLFSSDCSPVGVPGPWVHGYAKTTLSQPCAG